MTTGTTIDMALYNTSASETKSTSKNFADFSHDFENVYQSAKQNYSPKESDLNNAVQNNTQVKADNINNNPKNDNQSLNNNQSSSDKMDTSADSSENKVAQDSLKANDKFNEKKTDNVEKPEIADDIMLEAEIANTVEKLTEDIDLKIIKDETLDTEQNSSDTSFDIPVILDDQPLQSVISNVELMALASDLPVVSNVENDTDILSVDINNDDLSVETKTSLSNIEVSATKSPEQAALGVVMNGNVKPEILPSELNLVSFSDAVEDKLILPVVDNASDAINLEVPLLADKPIVQGAPSDLLLSQQGIQEHVVQAQNNSLIDSKPQTQNQAQNQAIPVQGVEIKELPKESITENVVRQVMMEVDSELVPQSNEKTLVDNLVVGKEKQSTQPKLSQEVVNQTHARIVGVESNQNPEGSAKDANLMNNQSSQEQIIKMSLEVKSTSPSESVGFLNVQSPVNDISLSKALDNVQPQQVKELNKTDILSQVNNQLNNLKETETSKVTIVLRPENLGKVTLELVNSREGLIARMTTENDQVRELLNKNLDSLRESLSSQGVSVNNVSVRVNETQKQDNMFSFDGNEQNKQGQNQKNAENIRKSSGFTDEEEENLEFIENAENSLGEEAIASNIMYDGQANYRV